MSKKRCKDWYGECLRVGDKVIPVCSEALVIGISGKISSILYNENDTYIDISDDSGNVLLHNVNSGYYTTKERYDERENSEYIYTLQFFNEWCNPITYIPLTNKTDPDYEIPDNTYYIELKTEHLFDKGKNWSATAGSSIYCFFSKDKARSSYDKIDECNYLKIPKTGCTFAICENYQGLKNEKELKKFIKNLIIYFNKADLTHINNEIVFKENEIAQQFEKDLIEGIKSAKIPK